jgi:hypothetical protein
VKALKILFLVLALASCGRAWQAIPLGDGYQIMMMNSEEVYVAKADNELILGPRVNSIGIAPGVIVVDCGSDEVVINGFANTSGLNVIDTRTGAVRKRLTLDEARKELASRNIPVPEMRKLSSYLP